MRIEERVGARVREAREFHGWSQRQLGQRLEHHLGRAWSPQAVYAAERGGRDFAIRDLVALARVLERPVAWFLQPSIVAMEEVQGVSGIPISERDMRLIYGVPLSEAPGIADHLRQLAKRIESLEGGTP